MAEQERYLLISDQKRMPDVLRERSEFNFVAVILMLLVTAA